MDKLQKKHTMKFILFTAILAGLLLVIFLTPLKKELNPERLKIMADHLSSSRAFPVLYFLIIALGVGLMLPAFAFVAGAGLIFGPVQGALISWPAVTAGALLAFACGRSFLHSFIHRHMHRMRLLNRLNRTTHENGFLFSLIARLILIVPWNVFNYAASLTSVSWKNYAAGTAIGILPEIVVMSMLGNAVKNAGKNPESLIIPLACNILIMTAAIIIRKKMKKRQNDETSS